MARIGTRHLVVGLAGLLLALIAAPAPAAGADRTFPLYGDATLGWGPTSGTITNPGPNLLVEVGDNVTLILNSTDGTNHNWFIDYDGDGTDDAGEPNSPNFRDAQITWNFTADRNGTFVYRCKFHPDTMTGNITIAAEGTLPPSVDTTPYVVAVLVVGFVAIVAVATWFARGKKGQTPPPPPS